MAGAGYSSLADVQQCAAGNRDEHDGAEGGRFELNRKNRGSCDANPSYTGIIVKYPG
jgi:hypothetical protein